MHESCVASRMAFVGSWRVAVTLHSAQCVIRANIEALVLQNLETCEVRFFGNKWVMSAGSIVETGNCFSVDSEIAAPLRGNVVLVY